MYNDNIKRSKERIKKTGEVFTPINYVRVMLDSMDIDWDNPPQDRTFLDPTCGEGVFLFELAERGIPLHNIYGCDLMPDNVIYVRQKLLNYFGRTRENALIIKQNIVCKNALEYDYSFGNKDSLMNL